MAVIFANEVLRVWRPTRWWRRRPRVVERDRWIANQRDHQALVDFHRRHADDPNFAMIGIVRDDTESAIRGYVDEEGVPYTVALDPGGRAALDFGTRGQPETYAISPDGVIAGSKFGPSTVDNLETMYRGARGQR